MSLNGQISTPECAIAMIASAVHAGALVHMTFSSAPHIAAITQEFENPRDAFRAVSMLLRGAVETSNTAGAFMGAFTRVADAFSVSIAGSHAAFYVTHMRGNTPHTTMFTTCEAMCTETERLLFTPRGIAKP